MRQLDILGLDVLPDIHLRPVTQWEDTELFTVPLTPVKNIPELWALVLRIPLPEFIAV